VSTSNDSSEPIKYVLVDRSQLGWEILDLEELIPADHPARIIWEVSGTLDLSRFEEQNKSKQGSAGRPCWPPQLLVSVWVYGYSIGIASARAIERLMGHDPALRWLAANQIINYHTLADFRVGHKEALEQLLAQFLALLEQEGVLELSTILHDGTKIQAVAGRQSYHRRKTLEKRMRAARKVMRALDRRAEQDSEGMEQKRVAAQQRAARESVDRIQGALKQMKKREAETPPRQHAELRVSESEPEARKMKQPDGGFALSYNVQVSTEAKSRMIVGIGVTAAMNDTQELMPALEKVEANCGETPEKIIADNGYATRDNVEKTAEQGMELIAPWKDDASREAGACKQNGIEPEFAPSAFQWQGQGKALTCPAGKTLVLIEQRSHHGLPKDVFAASEDDCGVCRFRQSCCGKRAGPRRVERVVESAAMRQYLARMKKPATQALYKKRSEIAEFPHLWAKGVKKWRRFSVRGLVKTGMEVLWVALAYNVTQWIRIRTAAPTAG
jgi:transposase